jgi:hypothetical protein
MLYPMLTRHVRLAGAASILVVVALLAPARPRAADDTPQFVITACVQGSVLTGATAAAGDTSARGFSPRYRLAGKKALVKSIKKEHADHIDEFTGTITGDAVTGSSVTMGKLSVKMGGTHGSPNAPYVPETPVFEVRSFRHLEAKCR